MERDEALLYHLWRLLQSQSPRVLNGWRLTQLAGAIQSFLTLWSIEYALVAV